MSKLTDKLLGYMAGAAEDAFWEAMGLASCGGTYEPKISEEVKALTLTNRSKIISLFDKLIK